MGIQKLPRKLSSQKLSKDGVKQKVGLCLLSWAAVRAEQEQLTPVRWAVHRELPQSCLGQVWTQDLDKNDLISSSVGRASVCGLRVHMCDTHVHMCAVCVCW